MAGRRRQQIARHHCADPIVPLPAGLEEAAASAAEGASVVRGRLRVNVENFAWDLDAARRTGVIPSFLQPLDKPAPMVATADVGRTAAEMLQQKWEGKRIVELEGPQRLSPNDIAAGFARALGKPVQAQAVPRAEWEALFVAQGMRQPAPRMRMLDGFNEGWIEFEAGQAWSCKGQVSLDVVLSGLVARG